MQAPSNSRIPLVEHTSRQGLSRYVAAVFLGCLLKTGVAAGMPMGSPANLERPGGVIHFSGAVVVGTCIAQTSGAAVGKLASSPAQGECHSGEIRSTYHVTTKVVNGRPAIPLLQYAKDRYGKVLMATYVYE